MIANKQDRQFKSPKMSTLNNCCILWICLILLGSECEAFNTEQQHLRQRDSTSGVPEELSSLIELLKPASADIFGSASPIDNLFVLIPSNLNLTDVLYNPNSDFNLFKLDTSVLQTGLSSTIQRTKRSVAPVSSDAREARKVNLFRNLFNKQKFSPLYLINGTVCRFISTGPVCTTISTNGLPVSLNGVVLNNAIANQIASGLNQQQQYGSQQQYGNQQGQFNNQPSNNQQQGQQQQPQQYTNQGQFNQGQQGQQFNNQQGQQGFNNNQQLRPAGLMDDETPDINVSRVGGYNVTSTGGPGSRVFKSNMKHSNEAPSVSIRPASLLASKRPIRQLKHGP